MRFLSKKVNKFDEMDSDVTRPIGIGRRKK